MKTSKHYTSFSILLGLYGAAATIGSGCESDEDAQQLVEDDEEVCEAENPSTLFGDPLWSTRYFTSSSIAINGLAVDSEDSVIVAGSFREAFCLENGPLLPSSDDWDMFVAKTDALGNKLWLKFYSGSVDEEVEGIEVDSDGNVIITGHYSGAIDFGGGPLPSTTGENIFLVKLDPAGQHVWSHGYGNVDEQDFPTSMAIDSSNNVFVSGKFSNSVDFGDGRLLSMEADEDKHGFLFLTKYSSDGQLLHATSLTTDPLTRFHPSSLSDDKLIVRVDSNDSPVMLVNLYGDTDFGSGVLKSRSLVLLRYTENGDYLSSQVLAVPTKYESSINLEDFEVTSTGGIVFTGDLRAGAQFGDKVVEAPPIKHNIFLAATDGNGQALWAKAFWADYFQSGGAIALDRNDSILLTGHFDGELNLGGETFDTWAAFGSRPLFVAEFDTAGNHVWSFTESRADACDRAMVLTSSDDLVVGMGTDEGFAVAKYDRQR